MSKISAGITSLTSLKLEGDMTGTLALGSGAGTAISIDTSQNVSLTNALPIASGGTGQTTATAGLNALLPSQTGNAGRVLQTDGTNTSWAQDAGGTVTSVDVSGGTTGLTTSGGPVTGAGTITLAGTLAIANGGTGQTTATAGFNALAPVQTANTGKFLTTDGTNAAWELVDVTADITGAVPIANGGTGQTTATTGFNALAPVQTANTGKFLTTDGTNAAWEFVDVTADITGAVPIANGGTGQTTATTGFNALAPTQTANAGKFLTTDGTNAAWELVDVTADITGAVPIANGGTGETTRQNAMDALAGAVTSGQYLRGNGTDVVMSAIQAGDVPTLNQNTTGTADNVTGVVAVVNGGTGASDATNARTNLTAAKSGANTDITSIALTTGTVSTTPTTNTDIANKSYVDGLVTQGISYHEPVFVESPNTAGNLTATYNQPGGAGDGVGATLTNAGAQAALTIDNVLMTVGKRVLIYNQTNQFENGVYTVTTVGTASTNWVLTRATDADTYGLRDPDALGYNDAFFVTNGDTGAGETYVCTTSGVITFGTTAITFAQISAAQVYSAGTGLTLSGTQFSITPAGTAGTYGSASSVPVITTNASGQVTSVTNTTISIPNSSTTATSANTANAIVARDASGNFSAGTITASLSGNATSATSATSATTATNLAGGVAGAVPYQSGSGATAFSAAGTSGQYLQSNGTLAPTWITPPTIGNGTLSMAVSGTGLSGSASFTANQSGNSTFTVTSNATSANTASTIVARDASGNFTAGTITAALSGNATTATSATTATTANALNTANTYQVNSLGVGTAGSGTAGEIRATNNITAYYSSDIKFKENISEIADASKIVRAIGGKLFDWTDAYIADHGGADGYFIQKQDFGVIAQDVLRVFPRAVRTRPDGSLAVDYEKLGVLAFPALVETMNRLDALEAIVVQLTKGSTP